MKWLWMLNPFGLCREGGRDVLGADLGLDRFAGVVVVPLDAADQGDARVVLDDALEVRALLVRGLARCVGALPQVLGDVLGQLALERLGDLDAVDVDRGVAVGFSPPALELGEPFGGLLVGVAGGVGGPLVAVDVPVFGDVRVVLASQRGPKLLAVLERRVGAGGVDQGEDGVAHREQAAPLGAACLPLGAGVVPASGGVLLEGVRDLVVAQGARDRAGAEFGGGEQAGLVELAGRVPLGGGRGQGEPGGLGLLDDRVEAAADLIGQRRGGVGVDVEAVAAVESVADPDRAEHVARVLLEVLVDADPVVADLHRRRLDPLPRLLGLLPVRLAAAEDQQVGDHIGLRLTLERLGRQADTANEVAEFGDLLAGLRPHGVAGERGGDDRDVAAGLGQGEGLADEVVVDAQPVRVVPVVVDLDVAERDVADRGGERVVRGEVPLEAVVADLLIRVQPVRNLRGHGVEFDADHADPVGGVSDEVAGTAARFDDPRLLGQPGLDQRVPHHLRQGGVGVVGVDGGAAGGRVLAVGEQVPQLGPRRIELVLLLVEHLPRATPARPAGQDLLLVDRGGAVLPVEGLHHPDRSDVGLDAISRRDRDPHLGTQLEVDGRPVDGGGAGLGLQRLRRLQHGDLGLRRFDRRIGLVDRRGVAVSGESLGADPNPGSIRPLRLDESLSRPRRERLPHLRLRDLRQRLRHLIGGRLGDRLGRDWGLRRGDVADGAAEFPDGVELD